MECLREAYINNTRQNATELKITLLFADCGESPLILCNVETSC